MESMTVSWVKGAQFSVDVRRHRLLVDQPVDEGGEDQGMTPVELLVASLGSCIGHFAARFCSRHQLPADGLRVTMAWDYAEQPHRVGTLTAHVHLPPSVADTLEPAMRARMQKVLEGCTVHNSIAITPKIDVQIVTAPSGGPGALTSPSPPRRGRGQGEGGQGEGGR